MIRRYYSGLFSRLARLKAKWYLSRGGLSEDGKIFTHMTVEELICLNQVVKNLSKRKINAVEIGSYLGASTCFIANALAAESKLYCIDTWGNDAMKYVESDVDGERRDTYEEFHINTKKYRNKIIEVRKWSSEALADISIAVKSIDFFLIDGDHSYEGVKSDWEVYSKFLVPDSIVAFHDTGWAEGVQRVVKEEVLHKSVLLKKLPNLEFYKII